MSVGVCVAFFTTVTVLLTHLFRKQKRAQLNNVEEVSEKTEEKEASEK